MLATRRTMLTAATIAAFALSGCKNQTPDSAAKVKEDEAAPADTTAQDLESRLAAQIDQTAQELGAATADGGGGAALALTADDIKTYCGDKKVAECVLSKLNEIAAHHVFLINELEKPDSQYHKRLQAKGIDTATLADEEKLVIAGLGRLDGAVHKLNTPLQAMTKLAFVSGSMEKQIEKYPAVKTRVVEALADLTAFELKLRILRKTVETVEKASDVKATITEHFSNAAGKLGSFFNFGGDKKDP